MEIFIMMIIIFFLHMPIFFFKTIFPAWHISILEFMNRSQRKNSRIFCHEDFGTFTNLLNIQRGPTMATCMKWQMMIIREIRKCKEDTADTFSSLYLSLSITLQDYRYSIWQIPILTLYLLTISQAHILISWFST